MLLNNEDTAKRLRNCLGILAVEASDVAWVEVIVHVQLEELLQPGGEGPAYYHVCACSCVDEGMFGGDG